MSLPRATMRLQFHRGFTFADAVPLAGYFAGLGISHIYASPIMTARPGSMHGYDTIDPTRINPELGGEEQFYRLVAALRQHDMGIIIDIVPNHMAVGSGNAWWMDVLAGGRSSRYAKYFDIDWEPVNPLLCGKVLLPVLGRPYGEALAAGELNLHAERNRHFVHYFDQKFPVADSSVQAFSRASPDAFDPAFESGRRQLHHLLEGQHYRLAWWKCANDEINWRRFFDINELAALRMEVDETFEAVHASIFSLYAQGRIDGVRVDHVDGLAEPDRYCRKLRVRLRELETERPAGAPRGPAYVIVEKILSRGEGLQRAWEIDGTTGYDFMDEVNALEHDANGEDALTDLWEDISGRPGAFDLEEELARRQILNRSFSAQLDSTANAFYITAQSELITRDISRSALRRVLVEILAHFPVYRTYARVDEEGPTDLKFVSEAVAHAKETCLPVDAWLIEKLAAWLSGQRMRPDDVALQNIALMRFQQLSAPLCAKAVEDTAFYRYGRLISRNDVGFDARKFACSAAEFHEKMRTRRDCFPHSMLATATHDHKRGEDVRARLAVLSEISAEWKQATGRWLELSEPYCTMLGGVAAPSAVDRAILFQTVVGAWPMSLVTTDKPGLAAYAKRIAAWQQKAVREAKVHTDWSAPSESYERAAAEFIDRLFTEPADLLQEIAALVRRIAAAGAANGLAQTVIKLTAPGVPDIYQGTEYWDLSLVDPDNRAAVDFAAREKSLGTSLELLASSWGDGRIKQYVIARALGARKAMPNLFAEGAYLPLDVVGPKSRHLVAYARIHGTYRAIIAACRMTGRLLHGGNGLFPLASRWGDTHIVVPPELQGLFSDVFAAAHNLSVGTRIQPATIFTSLPVALLTSVT